MDYVLDYYKMKLFTDDDMNLYVSLGWITQAQFDAVKAEIGATA